MWRWLKSLFVRPNIICVAGDRSCDLAYPSTFAQALANYRRTDRLLGRMEELLGKDGLEEWLGRPMETLGGRTPEQLLVANEFEPIERIVWWLESGVPV